MLKKPVQVVLSQSVSQNHDFVSAGALARMMALPGAGGITAAWKMQITTVDGMASTMERLLDLEDHARAIRNAVSMSSLPAWSPFLRRTTPRM